MHGLLLLAGLAGMLGGAGAAAYGFLHPEFRFADTGIVVGSILLTGGLLMLGVSAALARLQRIADTIEARPMPRALIDAMDVPAITAAPAPARTTTAGLAAVSEALGAPEVRTAPIASPAPEIPSPAATTEPSPEQSTEWPRVDTSDRIVPAELAAEPVAETATPFVANGGAAAASEPARVLKSGVIDGMAYTLYSDGSVDAELKGNTLHFASIAEWRAHLRQNA